MDKLSYALGLSMGNNFQGSGIKSLEIKDFADGLTAIFNNETPKMSHDEAKEVINQFFSQLQEGLKQENQKAGETFLTENKKRSEVKTTNSGLQYEIITAGNGAIPTANDRVECHYEGQLIDGRIFDSSIQRGTPAVFGVNQVIPGWVEALQIMPVGSKWKLYIPSNLAYGENGAGEAIAPNSTLIFDIELLAIK